MKLLALSEDSIIKFKKNKNIMDLKKRKLELKSKLRFKFVVYFIVGFVFLLFCLYYLTIKPDFQRCQRPLSGLSKQAFGDAKDRFRGCQRPFSG
jgi:hypothetical protein